MVQLKVAKELKFNLENRLSFIENWFFQNKLTVNTTKPKLFFFGKKNTCKKNMPPLQFQDKNVEEHESESICEIF